MEALSFLILTLYYSIYSHGLSVCLHQRGVRGRGVWRSHHMRLLQLLHQAVQCGDVRREVLQGPQHSRPSQEILRSHHIHKQLVSLVVITIRE